MGDAELAEFVRICGCGTKLYRRIMRYTRWTDAQWYEEWPALSLRIEKLLGGNPMKTFRPTFDRVLLRMSDVKEQSVGGIYLANSVASVEGIILSVGPYAKEQGFAEGMTCIIERGKATPYDINQPNLAIIKMEDIVAVEETPDHRLVAVIEPGTDN